MDFNSVDDNFDIVGFVAVHHHAEFDFAHYAVDTHSGEACLADMFEQLAVMTFSATDGRCQNVDAFATKLVQNQIGDLLLGVSHHFFSCVVGIGLANTGIEQTQKVVNFCDGAHSRARVFGCPQ